MYLYIRDSYYIRKMDQDDNIVAMVTALLRTLTCHLLKPKNAASNNHFHGTILESSYYSAIETKWIFMAAITYFVQ